MTETAEDDYLDITDWPSIPPNAPYCPAGRLSCYVVLKMRDGVLAEGCGTSVERATRDALRAWRRWKNTRSGQLAVDGHAYRRRQLARGRRKRG